MSRGNDSRLAGSIPLTYYYRVPMSKSDIYSQLFTMILKGEYPANSRLKETELASRFNVSRTPVREVIMQLARDGLVIVNPNRGAVVHPLTPDDVEEIYEIRASLELLALDFSVPRINLNDLRNIQRKLLNARENGDYRAATEIDQELHRCVVDSSEKKRLISIVNQMLRIMRNLRYLGFHDPDLLRRVTTEHLELIDALTRRDLSASKAILKDHLQNSKLSALRAIFEHPGDLYADHGENRSRGKT